MNKPILEARDISKSYPLPHGRLEILKSISFSIGSGETIAIMGASGSGKTTLLNILAGIDSADTGGVKIDGRVGLIFQLHYLMPELSALENVAIAPKILGFPSDAAEELLRDVGLGDRMHHLPSELSGGEAARVGIARALAGVPTVILADEPTGNLDEDTADVILNLLFETVRARETAMILVTHDPRVAARADRTLRLEHGKLA